MFQNYHNKRLAVKKVDIWYEGSLYTLKYYTNDRASAVSEIIRHCQNAWGAGRLDRHREGWTWVPEGMCHV